MSTARQLLEYVESTYTIECEACCAVDEAAGDAVTAFGAAEDFKADGWKVIDGEVLCPGCQEEAK